MDYPATGTGGRLMKEYKQSKRSVESSAQVAVAWPGRLG